MSEERRVYRTGVPGTLWSLRHLVVGSLAVGIALVPLTPWESVILRALVAAGGLLILGRGVVDFIEAFRERVTVEDSEVVVRDWSGVQKRVRCDGIHKIRLSPIAEKGRYRVSLVLFHRYGDPVEITSKPVCMWGSPPDVFMELAGAIADRAGLVRGDTPDPEMNAWYGRWRRSRSEGER